MGVFRCAVDRALSGGRVAPLDGPGRGCDYPRPMLGYQHEYHAGNHADVLKHALLVLAVEALKAKPRPFRVVDAHGGAGSYDLDSKAARRNREHAGGILKVLAATDPPPGLGPYLRVVREMNPADGPLRRYPGSPELVRQLLRAEDHLEVMEVHPGALAGLRRHLGRDRRVHVHERDCHEGVPAVLPPPERRGLVLLDPSYETKDEARRILDLLLACQRRFPTGVFLLWYPLRRAPGTANLPRRVAASNLPGTYLAELQVEYDDYFGLRGSGVIALNLPWGLDGVLAGLLPWLWRTLAVEGRGHWRAEWLVPPL